MAKSIISYFNDENNIKMIDSLKDIGVIMDYLGTLVEEDPRFLNKKFVLTGTISTMSRDQLKEIITSKGGNVTSSVSDKTDVVIVGDAPGSKYNKALKLGIEIWNEDELISILNNN